MKISNNIKVLGWKFLHLVLNKLIEALEKKRDILTGKEVSV